MKVTTYTITCTVDTGEGEPRKVFHESVPIGIAPTVTLERAAWRALLADAKAKVLPKRQSKEG